MAKLVFKSGVLEGTAVELPQGKVLIIGRARDVDLCVPDIKLSRKHCRIESGMTGMVIHDMGSTNGTYVNGRRVEGEAVLAKGDRIAFGDSIVEVVLEESIADVPTHVGLPMDIAEGRDPIAEIDLPLPPLPEISPATQAAQPNKKSSLEGLSFCDGCDVSIPVLDLEIGLAGEVGGRLFCKDCLARRSEAPAQAPGRPAIIPPEGAVALEEIRPAGGDGANADLLAALEVADDGAAADDPLRLMDLQGLPAADGGKVRGGDAPPLAAAPPTSAPAGEWLTRTASERRKKEDTLSRLKAQLMAEARGEKRPIETKGAPPAAATPTTPSHPVSPPAAGVLQALGNRQVGGGSSIAALSGEASGEEMVPLGEAIGSSIAEMGASGTVVQSAPPPRDEENGDDLVPLAEVLPPAGPPAAPPAPAPSAATVPATAAGHSIKPPPALDEDLADLEPIEEPGKPEPGDGRAADGEAGAGGGKGVAEKQ